MPDGVAPASGCSINTGAESGVYSAKRRGHIQDTCLEVSRHEGCVKRSDPSIDIGNTTASTPLIEPNGRVQGARRQGLGALVSS